MGVERRSLSGITTPLDVTGMPRNTTGRCEDYIAGNWRGRHLPVTPFQTLCGVCKKHMEWSQTFTFSGGPLSRGAPWNAQGGQSTGEINGLKNLFTGGVWSPSQHVPSQPRVHLAALLSAVPFKGDTCRHVGEHWLRMRRRPHTKEKNTIMQKGEGVKERRS